MKQPAAENVWNNNSINKKVSQSLTALKASCCHHQSQTPSAMSVQSDPGAAQSFMLLQVYTDSVNDLENSGGSFFVSL